MSLLWKKQKPSRISRFMSEFQQSPKRGGSLFVETGFPTSLIDLFVKNRDRLKKSSPKRLKRHSQTAPNATFTSVKPDAILKKTEPVQSNKVDKTVFVDDKLAAENKNVCVCVLMAFQIFIVSLLAFSTKKKLTIGITLSAFALLLTELAAARLLTRFKLSNASDKNAISRQKTETLNDSCLEEKTEHVAITEESNSKTLRIRDLLLKDEKSKSKSSKLKSKIVNKLRSYKKKKTTKKIKEETFSEVSSLVSSEDKSERDEEEEVLNPPLIKEAKEDQTNGIVVMVVIVLIGLLSGKILAIVITLSCLVLKFGSAKKSGLCI